MNLTRTQKIRILTQVGLTYALFINTDTVKANNLHGHKITNQTCSSNKRTMHLRYRSISGLNTLGKSCGSENFKIFYKTYNIQILRNY